MAKQNPIAERHAQRHKYYYYVKGPWSTSLHTTLAEARKVAKRKADASGQRVTIEEITERDYKTGYHKSKPVEYLNNPRGQGGIGYYYFKHPETGERVIDSDLQLIRRLAGKVARRLGREIAVYSDHMGDRV